MKMMRLNLKLLIIFVLSSLLFSAKSYAKTSMDSFEDDEFEIYDSQNSITVHDPLEKFNRKIFGFNEFADRYFIEHVARIYRRSLPQDARTLVRNFLKNLSLPFSLINSIAQGKSDNSMATFSTFLINSTIGIGGLFDVAGHKSIRYTHEDFGQTLGFYGVGSGIYIVLPILGPSSGRDLTGATFEAALSPMGFNVLEAGGKDDYFNPYLVVGINTLGGIDKRESLLEVISDIRKESFDPYATIRSAYIQKRKADINN